VAMPIIADALFFSKKCLNDTTIDDKPVKSTGVVMMRDTPIALGSLLNFNSLASPPALLVAEIVQFSVELSDVVQPVGNCIESKVSLKIIDLFCEKTAAEINNAIVSNNVFFIIFFFAVSNGL
jgi:hypothetical protein